MPTPYVGSGGIWKSFTPFIGSGSTYKSITDAWIGDSGSWVKIFVSTLSAPTGVYATTLSTTSIRIAWSASTGATGYKIERSPNGTSGWSEIGNTTGLYYDNTSLSPGTKYYYRVRAYSGTYPGTINSDYSSTVNATTTLSTPTGVYATTLSSSSIRIAWSAVSGATGYYVDRSPNGSSGWASVGTTTGLYLDNGSLTDGTLYYYRVYAYTSDATSGYSSNTSEVTTLIAPTLSSATASGTTSIDLVLTDGGSASESEIRVYISSTSSSSGFARASSSGFTGDPISANSTAGTIGSLTTGTQYWIKLVNYNSAYGESAYSSVQTATPTISAPTGVSVSTLTDSSLRCSWSAVTGASGYKVEVSPDGISGWTQYADTASLYADKTGLDDGTRYYFRVRAYVGAANSAYSSTANGVTTLITPVLTSASAASTSQIDLVLSDGGSVSESEIRIYWSSSSGGTYTRVSSSGFGGDPASANATSASITGLSSSTTYFFKIKNYNSLAGESDFSIFKSATTNDPAPSPPSSFTASEITSTRCDLAWANGGNTTDPVEIERYRSGSWGGVTTVSAGTTNYSDTGYSNITDTKYRIRFNDGSNPSSWVEAIVST